MNVSYEEVRYQVFVSSTFTDLKDERDKVLQAILECKAFPTGMELFPSADDEQFEFIKREIDSSDYYIVIIGGRYGSRADDGISFTEKEFDYAFAQGKPILAFLVRDPSKLSFDKCEVEAEGRAKLEQFREKAKRSRLVKQYSNPDELKAQVLQSLNYQFKLNPKRGWVPAGQSKREDLEEIRTLLNKVLALEAENAELRSLRKDPTALLGHGQDPVSWEIDVTKLVTSMKVVNTDSEVTIQFPPADSQLRTTWDELLQSLYSGGGSRLDSEDVAPKLLVLLASKISDLPPRDRWLDIALDNLIDTQLDRHLSKRLDLGCFRKAKRDIYRQLTGLGLIEEVVETRYQQPPTAQSLNMLAVTYITATSNRDPAQPMQVVVWKLTRRGEEQLALISGFRREISS